MTGACSTARIDDPIDTGTVGFLGDKIEAELLAHHPGEEPTHRVLLPISCRHDGVDGRALGASQHDDHVSLLRVRPETPLLPRMLFWTDRACPPTTFAAHRFDVFASRQVW